MHTPGGGVDFGPYLVDGWQRNGMGGNQKISSSLNH